MAWRLEYAFGAIVLLALSASSGCSEHPVGRPDETVRVGLLPTAGTTDVRDCYGPLLDFVFARAGVEYELVDTASYEDLLAAFEQRGVDLALFGGLTFIRAQTSSGAVPLVMRDIDTGYSSYFIARTDQNLETLEDARGLRFAFGSSLSTSGHLMPRHFLEERGLSPEEFFSEVQFSGRHDRTAELVRDGVVDLGVADARVIDDLYASGLIREESVQILWETPPYADYVWAAHPALTQALQNSIIDAFLELSADEPGQALILEKAGARSFLPAQASDFDLISRVLARGAPGTQ